MMRGMIGQLRRWLSTFVTDEPNAEVSFEQYSLYEIGDRLCRHYDGGRGYSRATDFGGYSMGVVLDDQYGGVEEITPSMVRDLDRLLDDAEDTAMQAKMSGGIDPNRVEQFRREFFDCFTQQQIVDVLGRLYRDARDGFGLGELVGEKTTGGHAYHYRTHDPNDVPVAMNDEPVSTQTPDIREESVSMEQIVAQFDLGETPIIETIEEMVETEAELLWDSIDVSGVEHITSGQDYTDSMLHAHLDVEESMYNPDIVVQDDGVDVEVYHDAVYGSDIVTDNTGVMDVPFVVADSDNLGYRVTASPMSVTRPYDHREPYVYRLTWQGNYVIVADGAVSGPA